LSTFALSIVLFAAVLHASWNALVKAAGDRALTLAAVAGMHAVVGVVLLAVSTDHLAVGWPSIIISTIVHYFYYFLMFQAYRLGDLSQVYPISRGMAPALVASGTYVLIGETLPATGIVGLGLVTIGIGLLAIQRGAAKANPQAIGYATLLGLTIAIYSVADGIGMRVSTSPTAYMGWLFLFESPVLLAILFLRKRNSQPFSWSVFGIGMIGGLFSVTAYATVLYAKTIAPIGAVSAVRESSVIIAALIGVVFLGERPWGWRLGCAVIVAAGVILLATGGQ
jgi:drug/metabolite transporter (DMT)-like permease